MRKAHSQLFAPYSTEPSYIYAAPELVAGEDVDAKQSDTFSLGAIFLEMVQYAKGRTIEELRQYVSAQSHDESFHANMSQVRRYIDNLRHAQVAIRNQRKRIAFIEESTHILQAASFMMQPMPRKRPPMTWVVDYMLRGSGRRPKPPRRNSLGARSEIAPAPSQSAFFSDLVQLDQFYGGHSSAHSVYGGE